jgi:hypothetical protein
MTKGGHEDRAAKAYPGASCYKGYRPAAAQFAARASSCFYVQGQL